MGEHGAQPRPRDDAVTIMKRALEVSLRAMSFQRAGKINEGHIVGPEAPFSRVGERERRSTMLVQWNGSVILVRGLMVGRA